MVNKRALLKRAPPPNQSINLYPVATLTIPPMIITITTTTRATIGKKSLTNRDTHHGQSFVRQESKVCTYMPKCSLIAVAWPTNSAIATTSLQRSCLTSLASTGRFGMFPALGVLPSNDVPLTNAPCSQVRQGIASNTKGTAFVVYEDVMDAKQACDKLNGYNFQNRYLVG